MAYENPVLVKSFPTITDLSSEANSQFRFVKFSSGNIILGSSAGELCFGVLQNKPLGTSTVSKVADVMLYGVTRLRLGATVTAGQPLQTKTDGTADVATTGDYTLAIALEAGDSGDIIAALLTPGGAVL